MKYSLVLTLTLGLGVLIVVLLENTCVTPYNEPIGIAIPGQGQSTDLSTKFTRMFNVDKKCLLDRPCHVYPTLADEANTKVVLNIHTHELTKRVYLYYAPEHFYSVDHQFSHQVT